MVSNKRIVVVYNSTNISLQNDVFNGIVNMFDHTVGLHVKKINYADVSENNINEFESEIHSADFVLLHFSVLYLRVLNNYPTKLRFLDCLSHFTGKLIAMPQDEGNHPTILDELFVYWRVDLILSVHYSVDSVLYPISRCKSYIKKISPFFIPNSWLNPSNLAEVDLSNRKIDLGYRGRPPFYHYGTASQLKSEVPIELARQLSQLNFYCDVSTSQHDRIYGGDWTKFLSSCKAVYGCKGGYTAVDFRGKNVLLSQKILDSHPGIGFDQFSELMPDGWDSFNLLTLTSRHFEAAKTGTAQVLVEGDYSPTLIADTHYIELKKDLSNIHCVAERLSDVSFLQSTVINFRRDAFSEKLTYENFVAWLISYLDSSDDFFVNSRMLDINSATIDALRLGVETDINAARALESPPADSIPILRTADIKRKVYSPYLYLRRCFYTARMRLRHSFYTVRRLVRRSFYLSKSIVIDAAKSILFNKNK